MRQVFFIRRTDGLIKVGCAVDVSAQAKRFEAVVGTVDIVAGVPGEKTLKKSIETMFSDLRTPGGWFRPEKRLLDYIEHLEAELAATDDDEFAVKAAQEAAQAVEWKTALDDAGGNISRAAEALGVSKREGMRRTADLGLTEYATKLRVARGVKPTGRPTELED
jgi:hypothetical protein